MALGRPDGPPHGHPHHAAPHHAHAPPVYNYQYAVLDDYHGTNFGHTESRDGYNTKGEYHVLLPDGRLQTVTYHVDGEYGGYVADVKYSGHAAPHPHPAKHAAPYHAPAPHHHA